MFMDFCSADAVIYRPFEPQQVIRQVREMFVRVPIPGGAELRRELADLAGESFAPGR